MQSYSVCCSSGFSWGMNLGPVDDLLYMVWFVALWEVNVSMLGDVCVCVDPPLVALTNRPSTCGGMFLRPGQTWVRLSSMPVAKSDSRPPTWTSLPYFLPPCFHPLVIHFWLKPLRSFPFQPAVGPLITVCLKYSLSPSLVPPLSLCLPSSFSL